MLAKPELAPNLNKAYKVEWTQLRASEAAFKAFEGGQIDLASTAGNAVIAAAASGLELKIIGTLSRETERGANTKFLVKKDGPSKIADLKGGTIGIIGYRSSVELWAREGLKTGGLNPDRDVTFAVMPFPQVPDAVRAGRILAGAAPDVFATGAIAQGDIKALFTSKTGVPFDEELIVIFAPSCLSQAASGCREGVHGGPRSSEQILPRKSRARRGRRCSMPSWSGLPPQVYFNLPDYVRDPGLRPNAEILSKQQQLLVSSGFQEKSVDLNAVVDTSYLPAN